MKYKNIFTWAAVLPGLHKTSKYCNAQRVTWPKLWLLGYGFGPFRISVINIWESQTFLKLVLCFFLLGNRISVKFLYLSK